ncbi:hypothetical protein Tco_1066384 [Tanacetum coccineum]|uniref:Uncharacterized protein n=1 Tax=Tanacetum coccineum TaxID=301880 RepID=A0ABQ5HBP4_9ASTR
MTVRCFPVLLPLAPDRSLVGKIQIVDVGKLWEHIPIVGWMIVENKRCGELRIGTHLMDKSNDGNKIMLKLKSSGERMECVDEIDKLAELIGKHEADQLL